MIEFVIISLLIICIVYYLIFLVYKKEKFVGKISNEKKIYLNPPTNANKFGIVESKIKCDGDICTSCTNDTCEGFEDIKNDDDAINEKISTINLLIGEIDNSVNIINENINSYKTNYTDFNVKLSKAMDQRNETVESLKQAIGYTFVEKFEDASAIKFKNSLKDKMLPSKIGGTKQKVKFILTA
jgi:hypothetical protein